jgi:hypothetical protein
MLGINVNVEEAITIFDTITQLIAKIDVVTTTKSLHLVVKALDEELIWATANGNTDDEATFLEAIKTYIIDKIETEELFSKKRGE